MRTVVITSKLIQGMSGPHLELLGSAGFEIRFPELPLLSSETETLASVRGACAVIAGSEPYTAKVLADLPDLRVISRSGVGVDRIDLKAATDQGIAVMITPESNHQAVAEFTIGLVFAVAKMIEPLNRQVRRGAWVKPAIQPLRGKTLGIIGLGRIGRSVAVCAAALRMRVLAFDVAPDDRFAMLNGVQLVTLDNLLRESDYVTLHVPLTDETVNMINRQSIALMKHGAFLVNTARGGLIYERDLLEALRSGRIAAAALDVFEHEPVSPDNPLLELDNVLATPHIAASDTETDVAVALRAARNILDVYRDVWSAPCLVNPEVRGRWTPGLGSAPAGRGTDYYSA